MQLRKVHYFIAIVGALLSGAFTLIQLRRECGAIPIVDCVAQGLSLGTSGSQSKLDQNAAEEARKVAELYRREREAAEHRAQLADEAKREAERRATEEIRKASEQHRREREAAELRAQLAEQARKEAEERAAKEALKYAAPSSVGPAIAPPIEVVTPSFGCQGSIGPTEQTICTNSRLARLDVEMAQLFFVLKSRLDGVDANRLRDSQRVWLRQRDACQLDFACIEERYVQRIRQLRASGGG